ncbi:MAG TPA: acetylxylan esterase [Terrimicrobiaceae bacterium]|nr:acetylxylan esterase [Terrimicrobiaceae bacterium]
MNSSEDWTIPDIPYNAKSQLWDCLRSRIQNALVDGGRKRDLVADPRQLAEYVRKLRAFFLGSIGGLPDSHTAVPCFRVSGETAASGFTIRKLLVETRPGVWATAHWYLPGGRSGPIPAILFLCGHSADGKNHEAYQNICQILVHQGLAVLALDPTGQGERLNYYDPSTGKILIRPATGDHEYSGLQCLAHAHNLSRYLLHDAIRMIDFLSAQPEIDPGRIGITGSSGGGTQTALMMLLEQRIAVAAPATFITSRQAIFDSGCAQDAEQIWAGFTGRGYDHCDLLAAFAPKPLCILSATYDYFPIEGTRQTLEVARRFWEMHGLAGNLRAAEDRSTHFFTEALGQAAADFFCEFLLGKPALPVTPSPIPARDLSCTRTGQVKGDFPDARTIHQENAGAFRESLLRNVPLDEALPFLREAVFRHRQPIRANLRILPQRDLKRLRCHPAFWWSQPGLLNSGALLEPLFSENRPVTLAVWEDGTNAIAAHEAWVRQETSAGRSVLVLNLTGMGPIAPHPFNQNNDLKGYYGTYFRLCDDLVTLGDSLAALRVHDVLQAVKMLADWSGIDSLASIRIYAEGPSGLYGFLAALLEPRLKLIAWKNPTPTPRQVIESEFYDSRNIKPFIIPGLPTPADWKNWMKSDCLQPAAHALAPC